MRVAHIIDGVVWEVADIAVPITQAFPPSMVWVEAPDDVQQGWLWDGELFSAPPVAPDPEPMVAPTVEQERDRARTALNPLRDTFLNRLAGIAVFTPDEDVKVECAELRIALLDITKDQAFLVAETYQDMEIALMSRYRSIAASASLVVRNVFKELEA